MSPEERLRELGIELPVLPVLDGPRLKRVVVHGGLAFLSGDGDGTVNALDRTLTNEEVGDVRRRAIEEVESTLPARLRG